MSADDGAGPVTHAELHAEIARRDQRIGELSTALAELIITVGRHTASMPMREAASLSRAVHKATTVWTPKENGR